MELESRDLLTQKLEELKNIFPEIFDDGVINIDKFKNIVALQTDEKSEHYSFNWSGKKECYQTIRQKSNATLKLDTDNTIPDGNNVFIEGDNLEVLKLLQTSYHKKIKMIYIDPPYNKDKDFVYKDTWGDTITNYLIQTDQLRNEGYTSTKTSSTGRRHTNWLNMIYPRLWLSRNLLRDDGVIFVSIDDDEVHNLRKVMDEIYGEENFVANVIWEKKFSPQNDAKWFSDNHDHILIYAKNKEIWRPNLLARTAEANARYKNPDKDLRGVWTSGDLSVKTYSANTDYPITTPAGRIVNPPSGYSWRYSRDKFDEMVKDNCIWFGEKGDTVPRIKRFLTDVQDGITPLTIWKYSDVGHNQEARQELNALFDGASYFDTPKPVRLIKRMLEIGSNANDENIILDFFAGSGTTAHAVMEQNQKDEGNRKYILVQLPEAIENDKFKKISDITKARIKIVIKNLDYKDGFKSYVLDNSNFQVFKELKKRPSDSFDDIVKMLKMSIFTKNIFTQSAKEIDIVYEVGLKNGFSLSAKNEIIKGEKYSFIKLYEENRTFYFCFADKVHTDIGAFIPTGAKLLCFDKALDDSTKQNLRENVDLETL
ncbi:MAG: site-specific DNA-methyltransferase [Sulfuricurvum sp.]|nr:site-specific DNA-methyltransferase [Sulfuricurvum sp.]